MCVFVRVQLCTCVCMSVYAFVCVGVCVCFVTRGIIFLSPRISVGNLKGRRVDFFIDQLTLYLYSIGDISLWLYQTSYFGFFKLEGMVLCYFWAYSYAF